MRTKLVALAGLALMLTVSSASAADDRFGSGHQLAISVDRLFGFYGYSSSAAWTPAPQPNQPPPTEWQDSQSGTLINFLWGNGNTGVAIGDSAGTLGVNPFIMPRLAFDYMLIDHLSVGGSFGYTSTGGTNKAETRPVGTPATEPEKLPDTSAWAFAPRVGFAYMFNDFIGIWPRLGVTYSHLQAEWTQTNNNQLQDRYTWKGWLFDLDIEAQVVLSPVQHFAFTIGPIVDMGLAGKGTVSISEAPRTGNQQHMAPVPDRTIKMTTYGLTAGLLGYF
jgi:opacity protein-like surface antigen